MAAPGLTGGLVAVGAVIVIALLLRATSGKGRGEESVPPTPQAGPEPPVQPAADPETLVDEDDDGIDDRLVVAVSSDGRAFVPDRHAVAVLPAPEEGEEWKEGTDVLRSGRRASLLNAASWHAGELRGVRVVRGEPEEGPWRLEGLGREGEYITFIFESREAADAARELFERQGVVHLGEAEAGRPMPPSA